MHHINRKKGQKPHGHLNRYRKAFEKNPVPLHDIYIYIYNKSGTERNFPNLIEGIYELP